MKGLSLMSWEGIHLTKLFVNDIKPIKTLPYASLPMQDPPSQEPSHINIYKEKEKRKVVWGATRRNNIRINLNAVQVGSTNNKENMPAPGSRGDKRIQSSESSSS